MWGGGESRGVHWKIMGQTNRRGSITKSCSLPQQDTTKNHVSLTPKSRLFHWFADYFWPVFEWCQKGSAIRPCTQALPLASFSGKLLVLVTKLEPVLPALHITAVFSGTAPSTHFLRIWFLGSSCDLEKSAFWQKDFWHNFSPQKVVFDIWNALHLWTFNAILSNFLMLKKVCLQNILTFAVWTFLNVELLWIGCWLFAHNGSSLAFQLRKALAWELWRFFPFFRTWELCCFAKFLFHVEFFCFQQKD